MSSPLARVRIKTAGRKRHDAERDRWRPADPPADAEVTESDEAVGDAPPRFYPFPLRSTGEADD